MLQIQKIIKLSVHKQKLRDIQQTLHLHFRRSLLYNRIEYRRTGEQVFFGYCIMIAIYRYSTTCKDQRPCLKSNLHLAITKLYAQCKRLDSRLSVHNLYTHTLHTNKILKCNCIKSIN